MNRCAHCNKETIEEFTSMDNSIICQECLEEEIYKERRRIYKKYRKEKRKKVMDHILIGLFIGFGISYFTVMVFLALKVLIK